MALTGPRIGATMGFGRDVGVGPVGKAAIMKLTRGAVALLVLWMGSAATQAQGGVTREQVLAELAEARRMGEMIAPGCGGGTLREQFPQRYPSSRREQLVHDAAQPNMRPVLVKAPVPELVNLDHR